MKIIIIKTKSQFYFHTKILKRFSFLRIFSKTCNRHNVSNRTVFKNIFFKSPQFMTTVVKTQYFVIIYIFFSFPFSSLWSVRIKNTEKKRGNFFFLFHFVCCLYGYPLYHESYNHHQHHHRKKSGKIIHHSYTQPFATYFWQTHIHHGILKGPFLVCGAVKVSVKHRGGLRRVDE